jgi:hypothetical protein
MLCCAPAALGESPPFAMRTGRSRWTRRPAPALLREDTTKHKDLTPERLVQFGKDRAKKAPVW